MFPGAKMNVAPLKMESSQATGRWRMSQSPCVAIWQSCSLAVAKHKYNNYIIYSIVIVQASHYMRSPVCSFPYWSHKASAAVHWICDLQKQHAFVATNRNPLRKKNTKFAAIGNVDLFVLVEVPSRNKKRAPFHKTLQKRKSLKKHVFLVNPQLLICTSLHGPWITHDGSRPWTACCRCVSQFWNATLLESY